jgi:uncharacterized protein Yka (UPF0111/DUF47 family)
MVPALTASIHETVSEMAALVAEATVVLTDATAAYVESLVTPGDPIRVTDAVDTIATLESTCDAHKYDALQSAFRQCKTADALVVRELLLSLDGAMDAVEDAGDHLLSMNSAEL